MLTVELLDSRHLEEVYIIEEDSFSVPMGRIEMEKDILTNPIAKYLAILDDSKVCAYAGFWHICEEGHIINFVVDAEKRKKGIGSFLMEEIVKLAKYYKIEALTLEVRVSNYDAIRLYFKHGFKMQGYRKEYYSEPVEDAMIMWKYL